jgi:anti-anti-sigma factor
VTELADFLVLRARRAAVVVECTGQHDLASRDERERLFTRLVRENELVVIDVSRTEFIDSSFLHSLVKADHLARDLGRQLRLQVETTRLVRSALEISGLLETLDYAQTREEALARRGGPVA